MICGSFPAILSATSPKISILQNVNKITKMRSHKDVDLIEAHLRLVKSFIFSLKINQVISSCYTVHDCTCEILNGLLKQLLVRFFLFSLDWYEIKSLTPGKITYQFNLMFERIISRFWKQIYQTERKFKWKRSQFLHCTIALLKFIYSEKATKYREIFKLFWQY